MLFNGKLAAKLRIGEGSTTIAIASRDASVWRLEKIDYLTQRKWSDISIFDENQEVEIRWATSNREWYISKGYVFTKLKDSFIVKAKDLSMGSSQKVKAQCDYCGQMYETGIDVLRRQINKYNKIACTDCKYIKEKEVLNKRSAIINYKKYLDACAKGEYIPIAKEQDCIQTRNRIVFSCPKHGVQTMPFSNFVAGRMCMPCSYEARKEKLKVPREKAKQDIESVNNNIWLNPNEYKNSITSNLLIKCGLCGNNFTTSYSNYIRHNINRCKTCSQKESLGELTLRRCFEKYGIDYEQEKRFDDCRDKKPLPFDFYLPAYNMCVEFDGPQHYKPIISDRVFERTKRHDQMKDRYCEEHNIGLLRIPYYQYSQIDNIVKRIKSKVKDIV